MSEIFELADRYVTEFARLNPTLAAVIGLPASETAMTDYSPDGFAERALLDRQTRSDLKGLRPVSVADRIAKDVMAERLGSAIDGFEAGEHFLAVNVFLGPLANIRQFFGQMPRKTEEDWARLAAGLGKVPQCLGSFVETVRTAMGRPVQPSPRQLADLARQADVWSGRELGSSSYFNSLVASFDASGVENAALRTELLRGATEANGAFASAGEFFHDAAAESRAGDACGGERYALVTRAANGANIDLLETYKWGWDEFHRIEREIAAVANRILPGVTIDEVVERLDSDPGGGFDSSDKYRNWLQDVHERTLSELQGKHFDIDPRLMRVECVIPPPGGGLAAFYLTPSEDFSGPGRTFWPVGTKTWFPRWRDVTTAYHEGVPGHHLQLGGMRCLADQLSRFQRSVVIIFGHAEGWALYAERLMAELGYLEDPGEHLGMLNAQLFRAARVILDTGLHLELEIPRSESFHPGERWTHDLALEFGVAKGLQPREFMQSETIRYLAQPGQATTYKVGERYWLAARQSAKERLGPAFNLKDFHNRVLALGPMGLDQLKQEVERFGDEAVEHL